MPPKRRAGPWSWKVPAERQRLAKKKAALEAKIAVQKEREDQLREQNRLKEAERRRKIYHDRIQLRDFWSHRNPHVPKVMWLIQDAINRSTVRHCVYEGCMRCCETYRESSWSDAASHTCDSCGAVVLNTGEYTLEGGYFSLVTYIDVVEGIVLYCSPANPLRRYKHQLSTPLFFCTGKTGGPLFRNPGSCFAASRFVTDVYDQNGHPHTNRTDQSPLNRSIITSLKCERDRDKYFVLLNQVLHLSDLSSIVWGYFHVFVRQTGVGRCS